MYVYYFILSHTDLHVQSQVSKSKSCNRVFLFLISTSPTYVRYAIVLSQIRDSYTTVKYAQAKPFLFATLITLIWTQIDS